MFPIRLKGVGINKVCCDIINFRTAKEWPENVERFFYNLIKLLI